MISQPRTADGFCGRDRWLLVVFGLVAFGVAGLSGRNLSTHETVHCQNVREMLTDHDWVVPHYGGRVWLERPPLPHWATAAVVTIAGDDRTEWPYRLAAALAGTLVVLEVGWMASVWYGRRVGLLAGATLATVRTHFFYSTGPEADIFLSAVVTTAVALFVRAEFVAPEPAGRTGVFGRRRWAVVGFFVALGLTNAAKGLFFGLALASLPVAGYLLGQRSWPAVRRYVWAWGWLAFVAAAMAWPAVVYQRQPDVVELWKSDYLGRLNQGYMREPWWYYLSHLPYCLFPWSPLALVGLWRALRYVGDPRSPERFLVVWALLPLAFLSVPQGKHHHYLLSVLAPWAILSATAASAAWNWARSLPAAIRSPLFTGGTTAVVAAGLAVALRSKIPLDDTGIAIVVIALAGYAAVLRWSAGLADPVRAGFLTCGLLVVGFWVYEGLNTATDAYTGDQKFVQIITDRVLNNLHPLDASWMLFYLPDRARLLHNVTFLQDETLTGPDVWMVAKPAALIGVEKYGTAERVADSQAARNGRRDPEQTWSLYRIRLHADRPRGRADVPISAAQATGRVPGPYLIAPVQVAGLYRR
jgi:4-amino-4-deoxy-L-arabinose transferase-like glycosyltransferase